uniref:Kelch domain-containing protein n=1 Tax=Parastrongyloides trichosuri TaxID=131310 RepID=A0A0N4Z001_PARTI
MIDPIEYYDLVASGCFCMDCINITEDPLHMILKDAYASKDVEQHSCETPLFFIIPKCDSRENLIRHQIYGDIVLTPMNYCFNPIDESVKMIKKLPDYYEKTNCLFVDNYLFVFNGFHEQENKDHVCKYDMEKNIWTPNIFPRYMAVRIDSITLKHPTDSAKAIQLGGYKKNGEAFLSNKMYDFVNYQRYSYPVIPFIDSYKIETGVSLHNGLFLFSKAPDNKGIIFDPRIKGRDSLLFDLPLMNNRENFSVTKNFESIFITGGECLNNSSINGNAISDDILEIDSRMLRIRHCGKMMTGRKMHCTFAYHNELYVLCGRTPNPTDMKKIHIYDLKKGTWRESKNIMPKAVDVNCCAFNENYFE